MINFKTWLEEKKKNKLLNDYNNKATVVAKAVNKPQIKALNLKHGLPKAIK